MTEVVAHIRLVHLKHVFEQFAQGENTLGMAGYCLQVAGVFGKERTEDEVGIFFVHAEITERCKKSGEMLAR